MQRPNAHLPPPPMDNRHLPQLQQISIPHLRGRTMAPLVLGAGGINLLASPVETPPRTHHPLLAHPQTHTQLPLQPTTPVQFHVIPSTAARPQSYRLWTLTQPGSPAASAPPAGPPRSQASSASPAPGSASPDADGALSGRGASPGEAGDAHMRVNADGSKTYRCPWPGCSKEFTQLYNIKPHYFLHSNLRPYKCEVEGCGIAFARSTDLFRHQRTHRGVREYICKGCGDGFSRRDSLIRHQKTSCSRQ